MSGNEQLKSFIERIERLEEEKKIIGDDVKSVYGDAKNMGYDTKILRAVIKLRKLDPVERKEVELLIETYMGALESVE